MASGIGIKQDERAAEITALGVIKRDEDLIAESIHRILNTSPFEYPRNPMGCRIKEILFEPNDYVVATLGAYYINDALAKYETRATIEFIDVKLSPDNRKVTARIYFRVVNNPQQLFFTTVNTGLQ